MLQYPGKQDAQLNRTLNSVMFKILPSHAPLDAVSLYTVQTGTLCVTS